MNTMITGILIQILILLMGVNPMAFSAHTPEGNDQLTAQIVALYDAAAEDINRLAGRAILELQADPERRASQFRQIRAVQMEQQIQRTLARLQVQTQALTSDPLSKTILEAVKRGDEELAKIGLAPADAPTGAQIGFDLIAGEAVEAIAADTLAKAQGNMVADLGNSIAQHGRTATELFRSVSESQITEPGRAAAEASINKAIARGLITGNPIIADRAIRELFAADSTEAKRVRKLGNKRITVGKATMSVRQYAATVAITRTREATVEGRHARLQEKGINLVQITGRNSRNFCTAFIGLVCSLGPVPAGLDIQVVELATLPGGAPPFHPRCSKGTAPYIHELASSARQANARRAFEVYEKRAASGRLLEPVKR